MVTKSEKPVDLVDLQQLKDEIEWLLKMRNLCLTPEQQIETLGLAQLLSKANEVLSRGAKGGPNAD